MTSYVLPLAVIFLSIFPISASTAESLYLDMTYSFNQDSMIWPTSEEGFKMNIIIRNDTGAFYIESNSISLPEHCGTHMDTPAHFAKGNWRAHEVPLDNLIGPAIKVNMKSKADSDRDALLEVADLQAWENAHGRIQDDVILMVYTGWGSRYPDKLTYLGTDTSNTSLLHFPGIAPEAATWLVENRKIKAVGIDTASLDYGQSPDYRAHQILYERNIPGFENVANLDKLPATGATVFAIPMKIEDGSGGPLRIFATGWNSDVTDPCSFSAGRVNSPFAAPFLMMLFLAVLTTF